jgi:hypothetical protein
VGLGTSEYNQKIAAHLENKAYKMLKKDPTERKTVPLKSPQLLRRFANNIDHKVSCGLESMGCRRSTSLMFH